MIKIRNSLTEEKINEERSNRRFLLWLMTVVAIAYAFIIIFTQMFLRVEVSGDSMVPTLSDGDVLIVNKYREIKRGDIVIINKGDKWVVKRVIALGGDTLEITNGVVKVNGIVIDEDYILSKESTYPSVEETKIKENEVYYLGDNRGGSYDSRREGPCKLDDVLGVVSNFSLKIRINVKEKNIDIL